VLRKLEENNLAVAAHKSVLYETEVEFIRYMVNEYGLRMSD